MTMESSLIDRQAAIDALKEHRALYCDNTPDTFSKLSYAEKSRVDELDTAIATLVNLPSAQPDLNSAYTEGYTQAEAKYRALLDEMQATKQDAVEDAWNMFQMISSAWYGKGCYSRQDDGSVYSRLSCRYMTFDDAVREFMREIDDD